MAKPLLQTKLCALFDIEYPIILDGSDCSFLHLIGGFEIKDLESVKATIRNGMRVRAVWRDVRVGGIMDIKYFEPVSG